MTTISLPKTEYLKIIKNQEQLRKKVDALQNMFKLGEREEISPEYLKKLDHISRDLDGGKGARFLSAGDAVKFLDNF